MKKKIMIMCDVPNWGGHERAEYIKKYLSDEWDFDIKFNDEFKKAGWSAFHQKEFKNYNLYYLMFHTMLGYTHVRRMLNTDNNKKVVSVITGSKVVKKIFKNDIQCYKLINLSAGIAVNNKIVFRKLRKVYKKKIYYLPRGVDENVFYPTKDNNINQTEKLKVLYVGKHVAQKGLDSIIKPACEKAGVELITNTRIWNDALNKDEMRDLYNSCNLYLVASSSDGTPNPALESASCGLPIISNLIGNMPEFISEGENGFIVEKNIDAYVEKIKYLDRNRNILNEMGKNARQTILNEWTWAHSMKKEREMIRGII